MALAYQLQVCLSTPSRHWCFRSLKAAPTWHPQFNVGVSD